MDVHYQQPGGNWPPTVVTLLNPIQEGSGFYQRIGLKTIGKSLRVTGNMARTGLTPASTNDYARVMILYDREPQATLPVLSDILSDTDAAGNATSNARSGINLRNSDRFLMLRDKRFDFVTPAAITSTSDSLIDRPQPNLNFDEYIKLLDVDMHFNGTASPITVANISTGALYLVTVGLEPAATAGVAFVFKSRLRYCDP